MTQAASHNHFSRVPSSSLELRLVMTCLLRVVDTTIRLAVPIVNRGHTDLHCVSGHIPAESLDRRDVLRLQADPPARESVRRAGAPVKNSSQESVVRRFSAGYWILHYCYYHLAQNLPPAHYEIATHLSGARNDTGG